MTTETRYRDMPDVPTIKESGLPQLSLSFTAGFVAPAGTPAPILDTLNAAINETLQSPELIGKPWPSSASSRSHGRIAQYAAVPRRRGEEVAAIVKATGVEAA